MVSVPAVKQAVGSNPSQSMLVIVGDASHPFVTLKSSLYLSVAHLRPVHVEADEQYIHCAFETKIGRQLNQHTSLVGHCLSQPSLVSSLRSYVLVSHEEIAVQTEEVDFGDVVHFVQVLFATITFVQLASQPSLLTSLSSKKFGKQVNEAHDTELEHLIHLAPATDIAAQS